MVGGKLDENNQTVVDPTAITRYPLMLEYKDGLVTVANYDGFKTKFIGSWDMPFASYRISNTLTKDGKFAHDADLVAVANCDEIEFYGIGLKLIGMSEFKTGQMFVRGATKITSWPDAVAPSGVGNVKVTNDGKAITAEFSDTSLKADEHVFSLLLTDAQGESPAVVLHQEHIHRGKCGWYDPFGDQVRKILRGKIDSIRQDKKEPPD